MHLILTGSTGLVGSAVLSHILSLPASQMPRVSILARNKNIPLLTSPHPNVTVIQHDDFLKYPEVLSQLSGATGVIWALGISQTEVSKEQYTVITKDYALAAAKAFSSLNKDPATGKEGPVNFVYVSGEGATWNPGRFTPIFGRVKGETESALIELAKSPSSPLSNLRIMNVRPAAVDPAGDEEVLKATAAKRAGWKHGVVYPILMPLIRALSANMVSPTKDLGRVLTELAMGNGDKMSADLKGVEKEGEGRVLGNVALRRLAGLKH